MTDASDRGITALAILKVNFDRDRSFLGNYLPFVYHCLSGATADVVSAPDLQAALAQEFGIDLPQAVLRRLLSRAADDGKVRLESGVYAIVRGELDGCSLEPARTEVRRGYRQLLDEARAFAATTFGVEWSERRTDQLMTEYVDGFSSAVLAAVVTGRALPPPGDEPGSDAYVLHRFVLHAFERNQQLFEFLEAVVKGRMLADALHYELEGREPSGRLDGLEVYFDGPLLLHLLGYAGPELQQPVVELCEMLKRQGAILRAFEHSATEAREILDAAASRVWTGSAPSRFHGDVVSHLVRSGKSRSDIELMSERLERDLLQRGVQTVGTPPRNVALQPDEERLEEMLQRRINYGNPRARARDVDSLTAVHRLRRGRAFRDLAESVAVFVTRNWDVFRVSAEFFEPRQRGRSVPQCVYHTSFTVLVWLHEPLSAPGLPRERIIADAYAALNPGAGLWHAYNDEIDRLREAGTLDDDDVRVLRFADESRRALMDLTLGEEDAFTEGTVAQVLERSRETARAALRSELADERAEGRRVASEIRRSRDRVANVSEVSARWIADGVFTLLVVALGLGTLLGPVGPIDVDVVPAPLQIVCAVFALTCGLWTVIHRGSLTGLRRSLKARLRRTIEARLIAVFAIPPAGSDSEDR